LSMFNYNQQNSERPYVFLYGSLKSFIALEKNIDKSVYLGNRTTEQDTYDMVSFGVEPAVVEGGSFRIQGELYRITEDLLQILDTAENNGVLRKRVLVKLDDTKQPAWMYVLVDDPEFPMDFKRSDFSIKRYDDVKFWIYEGTHKDELAFVDFFKHDM
jgi:gamma-glutamylcyclotransferase (GGCT)/AIG2-like uncharacterized protein YtfP